MAIVCRAMLRGDRWRFHGAARPGRGLHPLRA
jgi:hypothetical protein